MSPERRVLFALAATEARRHLRNPLILAGGVGSAYLVWRWASRWAPVWPEMSAWMAGALLPLAAASWFAASWLAARDRRNTTGELVQASPVSERVRDAAQLMSGVTPLAFGVTVLVLGAVLVANDAVGKPLWWEIVGGPAIVAFAWVGGFVLGRFSSLLAVLAFPVLAHWTLIASPDVEFGAAAETGQLGLPGLAPWIPPSLFEPAEQALLRPSALHTVFLLALTAAVATWFLLRHERRLWALVAVASLLLLTVVTARRLIAEPLRPWNWTEATLTQPCEQRGDVTYCFYPMYRPWVDDWEDTLETVADLAPLDVAAVVQQPGREVFAGPFAGRTDVIAAPIRWDRRGQPPERRFVLAADVASRVVGLGPQACSAAGQGRLAFVLWVASVASNDRGAVIGDPERVAELVGHWLPDAATIRLAARLATRDVVEVAEVFSAHLDDLRNGTTSTQQVAEWFGAVTPPASGTDASLVGPCR